MTSSIAVMFIAYAVLLLVGGLIGHSKAKSKPSLIAGVITGVIALAIGLLSITYPMPALALGFVLGFALGIFFTMRFVKTKKPMPAIPMAILSDLVGIASIVLFVLRR